MKKRLLALLLTVVMVVGIVPVAVLPAVAGDAVPASSAYTYDDLYVRDADGDGNDDIAFLWDAFDVTESTEVTGVLENRVDGGADVTYSAALGRAHDKFMTFYQVMEFGHTLKTNVVNVGGVDYRVDNDETFELLIAQDPTVTIEPLGTGYHTSPVTGQIDRWQFGAYTFGAFKHFTLDVSNVGAPAQWNSQGPIDKSYGYIALTGVNGLQAYFTPENWAGTSFRGFNVLGDTVSYASQNDGRLRFFGAVPGEPFAMTSTVKYTMNDDGYTGTGLINFLRNGAKVSPWYDTSDGAYVGVEKQVYAKYEASAADTFPVLTSDSNASYSRAAFGHKLGFAFYAVRLYNTVLTEAQIAQNHFADLLGYYDVAVPAKFMTLADGDKAALYASFANTPIGGTSKDELESIIKEMTLPSYTDLYVTDANGDGNSDLAFAWDAFDVTEGAALTGTLVNRAGGENVTYDASLARAHDGYISFYQVMEFGHTLSTHIVNDGGVDYRVDENSTFELLVAQDPNVTVQPVGTGYHTSPVTGNIDQYQYGRYSYGPFNYSTIYVNNTATPSAWNNVGPIDASYGYVASTGGGVTAYHTPVNWKGTEFRTYNFMGDNLWTSALDLGQRRMFGDVPGVPFTMTSTVKYTLDGNGHTGVGLVKFFRNGAQMSPWCDTSDGGYANVDKEVFIKYAASEDSFFPKLTASATTSVSRAAFGHKIGFAFYAVRLYNTDLTKEQIAQNHFADLVGYYDVEVTEALLNLSAADKDELYSAFAETPINGTSTDAIEAAIKEVTALKYTDLYVTDANGDGIDDIAFAWDAFDVTTETTPNGVLDNRVLGGADVTYNASKARAHDGFMTFYQIMAFGNTLSTHTVGDYIVDEDSTFELLIAQDPTVQTKPLGTAHVSPVTGTGYRSWGIYSFGGPFNAFDIYVKNSAAPSIWNDNGPMDVSYGYISASSRSQANSKYGTIGNDSSFTALLKINFMGDNTYSYKNDGERRMFGAVPGVPFAMTSTIKYYMNNDGYTGFGHVEFFRNGAEMSPFIDSNSGAWIAPTNDVLLGYTAQTSLPAVSDNYPRAAFGHEIGFAFYAVRLYNADLSEEQIAQNHFVDLLGYHDVPISDAFLNLAADKKAELYASFATTALTDTNKAAIELAIKSITAPKYTDLYVTDADGDGVSDLTFAWDAFDITASSFTSNTNNPVSGSGRWPLVNRVGEDSTFWNDGALTAKAMEKSIILYGHRNHATPAYGRGSNGLNLKPGLNYTTASTGEIVFDDMTMEISLAQSSTTVLAPLGSGQKHESINPYYDGGSYANAVRLGALDWGFSALNTEAEHPIDESYGFVSSSYRAMKEAETNETVQIASDVFWMPNGRFLGNYVGDPFYIAITQDYEMDTETTGTVNMKFFRDGANTLVHDKGTLEDGVTVNYTAQTMATLEWQAGVYLNIGMQFYTARMYNKTLSNVQIAQNHFADLVGYHGVNLVSFPDLTEAQKADLFMEMRDVQYNDTDKEEIEAAIEVAKLSLNTVLSFDGYQVRMEGDPGIRARFAVDLTADEIAEGVTLVEVGAIAAIAGTRTVKDLTVAKSGDDYVVTGNQMMKECVYQVGGWTPAMVDGVSEASGYDVGYWRHDNLFTENEIDYSFAIAVLHDTANSQTAIAYQTDLIFRGYVVYEVEGVEYVWYTDMTDSAYTFKDAVVSLYDLSKLAVNSSHPTSQAVIAAVNAANAG